ncbi:TRAP transporter permease [Roseinatronobacter alkalisoli]|uniref:TRAP transporter fused permease subunit n=1 Tax=Roseinatronobacter alkalisoli TaxID=3028235 RepID=A0ABT5T6T4_9RHOB|nr:TRAP transporter fused permease subunit [Roseinatronobacter sp. HJB301]MDD7970764.1 TRAP transporter fused permease subunit [Roseinatronobacter sp. HJB301]
MSQTAAQDAQTEADNIAKGVDNEIVTGNQRVFAGVVGIVVTTLCILYTVFHVGAMNGLHDRITDFLGLASIDLTEPWRYRLIHVAGGLALGFILFSARALHDESTDAPLSIAEKGLLAAGGALILLALGQVSVMLLTGDRVTTGAPAGKYIMTFGYPLIGGTVLVLLASWIQPIRNRTNLSVADTLLAVAAIVVGIYIIGHADLLRTRAQVFPHANDMWASIAGIILILELTRRLAGLALVIIVGVFLAYGFVGPWLPGVLNHRGYAPARFFGFIYTDNGILGPTTAISSTYIILFITFAAFLQASRVGEYFVNFAFAAAGGTRGGPAKVAVFASGLMGMINGTSAGNVVSTGSLTIPLMKKVGYRPQTAASVEAAASSGGQILPPIMGAGAFIMAEITGIAYRDIVIAAIIPAILYFTSVYFMVDKEALKKGMKGLPRDMLPRFDVLARRVFLFIPIIILIGALFMGYSVIRAGTLAMASAAVVSWFTPHKMLVKEILYAFEIAARMSLQLVAVCAAAGIIVGVIALTGVGTRFSSMLLGLAGQSQLLALVFAMLVAIILGMGMPTTAAYAVAAAVIAPGLIRMGIEPLTAHFFIFYYAVMSAITPPVALAAYAGAAIAQSDPMRTSVESFKIGLAAFIVPFIFFFNDGLLMQGDWFNIIHVFFTALLGIYLLASAVQGWLFGDIGWPLRLVVGAAAIAMISGGWISDALGLGVAALVFFIQRGLITPKNVVKGHD